MSTVKQTPKGWPFLEDASYIADTPEYTRELAGKLERGDSDKAAIINAAEEAKRAAREAEDAANKTDYEAILAAMGLVATSTTPLYAGTKPPVGTRLKQRFYKLVAVINDLGEASTTLPDGWRGITSISVNPITANVVVSMRAAIEKRSTSDVMIYVTTPNGTPVARPRDVEVSVLVQGW